MENTQLRTEKWKCISGNVEGTMKAGTENGRRKRRALACASGAISYQLQAVRHVCAAWYRIAPRLVRVERPKNFLELRTCRQTDRLERAEGTNSRQTNATGPSGAYYTERRASLKPGTSDTHLPSYLPTYLTTHPPTHPPNNGQTRGCLQGALQYLR